MIQIFLSKRLRNIFWRGTAAERSVKGAEPLLDTSTIYRRKRGGYLVHSDRDAIDLDEAYAFLRTAPWAQGMTRAGLERSLRHSLCFSLQKGNRAAPLGAIHQVVRLCRQHDVLEINH